MIMDKKYGLYCMGSLVNTYDDAIEAHNDAVFAQEESGVPHEVKEIKETMNLNHFKFKLSEKIQSNSDADFSRTVFEAKRRGNSDLYDVTNNMYDEVFIYIKTNVDKYIENGDWILV